MSCSFLLIVLLIKCVARVPVTGEQSRRASLQLRLLPLQPVDHLLVLLQQVRWGVLPRLSVIRNLRQKRERQRESAGEEPWKSGMRPCDRKHLSLQSLPVVAEETKAVQFVLWRRAAGLAAPPAACLMSGFGARRRSLIQRHNAR